MNDLEQAKKVPRCPKWRGFFKQLSSWRFLGWDRRILTGWILDLFQPLPLPRLNVVVIITKKFLKVGFRLTKKRPAKTPKPACFFLLKPTMKKITGPLEEKEAKAAGKFRGFRVEILCASLEELDKLLPHLGKNLEVRTGVRKTWVFSWKKVETWVCPGNVILHLWQ